MGSRRGAGARTGGGACVCVRVRVYVHNVRVCWAKNFGASFAIIATYAHIRARIAYPYAPVTPAVTAFVGILQLFAKVQFNE